jgi:transketolase
MLNSNLSKDLFKKGAPKIATRQGFGEGMLIVGEKNEKVVVLTADLEESTFAHLFADKFPQRFIEVGVAEQALATVAAGMANYGKIPFICSFAVFSPGRNWEQIKTTVAINNVPVKIVGSYEGFGNGVDGATHQAFEDIALMRVMPNMLVLVPCDALEAKKAAIEAVKTQKPVYIRLTREATPLITTKATPFKIGQAEIFWQAKDPKVTIFASGHLLSEALKAAKILSKSSINCLVVNIHTIKPLDTQTIIRCAKLTDAVVTVEEHQIAGGMGSAVAETLSSLYPTPIEFVGMHDSFGESGQAKELLEKYKMTAKDIVLAAKRVIKRKNE